MRWLVGWSSVAARYATTTGARAGVSDGAHGAYGAPGAYDPHLPPQGRPYAESGGHVGGRTVQPVGAQLLWGDPDPLWAVGDWRPDEVRVVSLDDGTRLAVLGCCAAGDDELRRGLVTARGGALRHLTAWPGSYTAVVKAGRRVTVTGDLAGARPVFHTPWEGGTAYATAALPLADLVEAQLDIGHLAALLACPESPEALRDSTPYEGVRRVPPGHALILREGSREITGYETVASLAVAAPQAEPRQAVEAVRDALVESVRARLTAPRHAPEAPLPDPGPVPGMGPADRRAARGAGPVPGIGADLSGGSASATLALLAAGLPGVPGTILGHGADAGERLLAVTFNDLAAKPGPGRTAELERARELAADPRLRHVVVTAGEEALPYAALDGPLTDEPGPALVTAERHRRRLAGGSADHFTGLGARQVLDAHPARLADLLMDRRRRSLVRPVTALAKATGPSAGAFLVPVTVYRAARRLARTPYRAGLETAARHVLDANRAPADTHGPLAASLSALAWSRPGPAARWLTGEALAEVSARLNRAATLPPAVQRPGEARARAALARAAADHRVLEQAAEIRGQRLHAPFLDNQVVRACRDLPEALRVQPDARAGVLRTVLADTGIRDLPPGWGAPYPAVPAGTARAGLRAALPTLLALFEAPLLADAGLIEAGTVRDALRAAADGARVPLDGLADLVSTELWLHRLLARRGSCWTDTATARAPRAVQGPLIPASRSLTGR
ncbi:asparagine synthase [Streptomyces sp. R302]|uniref:asparagine synthase-related protein n=1 Tax=unclassified Streptomyces TaxID=2593676 RepID=UPI00145EEBA3|nr:MULTISPECIES: asparagine synthase-related protein [unclassified Streptomyces]NML53895.1 asparagine synthase [Streptomyces sp. R301]NML83154.1 asparagine synthase [Streptomyces sp. R302]